MAFSPEKIYNWCIYPPVLAPKKDLMSRKIMQVDVFVMLMHALYTQ